MTSDTYAPPRGPARRSLVASWLKFDRRLLLLLLAFAAYYLVCYALSSERPAGAFLGWRGWADQSEYFKSIRAFASANWDGNQYFYPPFYTLASSLFWPLLHWHAPLAPDLVFFLTAFGTVLAVSRRFYGLVLPVLVCAALFAFAPIMSIHQWVVPWTSSASAALASVLILIYARAEAAAQSFRLASRRDWALFTLFFLAYGALITTRPLDTVVWLPFAAAMFLRTAWATAVAEPGVGRRLTTVLAVGALAAGPPLMCLAAYLGFNEWMFHSLFGIYGAATLGSGYFPGRIPERLFSFLWDSGAAFAEPGHALFQHFPLFGPILALCLVTLLVVRDVRSWIIATAFFHFLLYLPYGDLLPNGFFRFYNLHYFKWAYPWLAVIAVGQTVHWGRAALAGRWRGLAPLGAAAVVTAVGWAFQLEPANLASVPDLRAPDQSVTVVAPAPRKVEFIDIPGASGSFPDVYFGIHKLTIDGRPFTGFRLLPKEAGVRLLLLQPQTMSGAVLRLDPKIKIEPGPQQSVLGETRIMLAALYRDPPVKVAWSGGQIDFNFSGVGGLHGAHLDSKAWSVSEPNGRWTTAHRGALVFVVDPPPGDIRIESAILPLHNRRAWGFRPRISLWINGCRVADERIDALGPRTMRGLLPAHCMKPGGEMRVEWRADDLRTPRNLHIAPDDRVLGVMVWSLSLVQAPGGAAG